VTIGPNVRQAREARGLSQRQLAHLAGVDRATLANVEADRFGTTVRVAEDLARALGTTVGALLGEAPSNLAAPRGSPAVPWDLIRAEVGVLRRAS
jgi:transcriptional regulator with XRE-family HTH domain